MAAVWCPLAAKSSANCSETQKKGGGSWLGGPGFRVFLFKVETARISRPCQENALCCGAMGPYLTNVKPNQDSQLAGIFASTILCCRGGNLGFSAFGLRFRVQGQGGVRRVVTQGAGFICSRLPQTCVCSHSHPPVNPKKKHEKRGKKAKKRKRGLKGVPPEKVQLFKEM